MTTIYRLKQISWNNGRSTDFDLPRTIGFYSSHDLATTARARHSALCARISDTIDDTTTADDYRIDPVVLDSIGLA